MPDKAVYWAVKWGDNHTDGSNIRLTTNKHKTVEAACRECWGMIAENMLAKDMGSSVTQLRKTTWRRERIADKAGWVAPTSGYIGAGRKREPEPEPSPPIPDPFLALRGHLAEIKRLVEGHAVMATKHFHGPVMDAHDAGGKAINALSEIEGEVDKALEILLPLCDVSGKESITPKG